MTFFDDKAYTINDLIVAVINIELALGSLPAGAYASVRTRLDILEARINNPNAPAPNVNNPFYIGGSPISGVSIQDGYGDPNVDSIAAVPGSLFLREDGVVNLYSRGSDGYWRSVVNASSILFNQTLITLASSGTTTISVGAQKTPNLKMSTVSLTGPATLALNGVIGIFFIDFSGVTLAEQTMTITNGAGSANVSNILATSNKTLLIVKCDSASTLSVG